MKQKNPNHCTKLTNVQLNEYRRKYLKIKQSLTKNRKQVELRDSVNQPIRKHFNSLTEKNENRVQRYVEKIPR